MSDAILIEFLPQGGVVTPQGFVAGAARGGIKTQGDDVILIVSEQPATAAAVFTHNAVKAAPVWVSAEHAAHQTTRAIIANAGNANCCTGERGLANARQMCELAAMKLGCSAQEVLVCSTGIIGHQLPIEKVTIAVEAIELQGEAETNEKVARASMTTDTRPKFCAARMVIDGKSVSVGGQVKGVGMIGPDMAALQTPQALHATLLAFLTTDAEVEKTLLQQALERGVQKSFNSVTVDGDTSTNDTAFLLANDASGVSITEANFEAFCQLVEAVCIPLAKMVAADGEGATKLVTIEVKGAATAEDAKRIAMTIANSPLVKTAIFGRDPNWGRLAMAAGRSGVVFNPQQMSIYLDDIEVFRNGEPTDFAVAEAEATMSREELTVRIQLGAGQANWTAWTCDFSYDYVKINAEYHT
ncbi:MAG: bifunctional glutamate N-acetyltransferase/amino-acid acetyltransferase ArgJ [Abitibacteriaceae bacterium]|nr:bifunctional glutamate N-acetyltransferase/amino-acid acetyltransferase ArgJ [Abditibacteriaceae bacterium]